MDNVIQFPKATKRILICMGCGCRTFIFYEDNEIECANCHQIMDTKSTIALTKNVIERNDLDSRTTRIFNESSFAVSAVMNGLKKSIDSGEIATIVYWNKNGSGNKWIGTDEAIEWIKDLIKSSEDDNEQKPI